MTILFLQKILAFVFALGILIIFHELGHFWVARLCGVRVLRFSVGMGKPLWIKKFGNSETEWTLSAIPLGGYVKFYDSREIDASDTSNVPNFSAKELDGDFSRKSVWQRIAIVAAGPMFNFILAIVLFAGLFTYGTPDPLAKIRVASTASIAHISGLRQGDLVQKINGDSVQSWSDMRWKLLQLGLDKQDVHLQVVRKNVDRSTSLDLLEFKLPLSQLSTADFEADFLQKLGIEFFRPAAVLNEVVQGGPASKAGLKAGDQVLQINEQVIVDSQALVEIISASPNKPLTMLILGTGQEFEIVVTPDAVSENGKLVGRIQVKPQGQLEMTVLSYPLPEAIYRGGVRTWDSSVLTIKMIGKMLTGEVSWRNITGPITIADYAGQTARIGWLSYLQFIALISISLGVMNLLPIPVLDGGHLLYYSLEVLTGKTIPEKYVEMAQRGGLTVLLCLMLVAFFNDIVRQMS